MRESYPLRERNIFSFNSEKERLGASMFVDAKKTVVNCRMIDVS
jgi:hypothetical protein